MKNTIKSTLLVLLTIACAYIVKSQACTGYHNTISYPGTSSALGSDNNVYGRNCFISGTGNNVYGRSSVAIGTANTILSVNYSDYIAFAIGDNNSSTSNMSFAIGDNNTSDNTFSFAIGRSNQSHASTSYAIGYSNTNTSLASPYFAVGFNNTNSAQHSISIGERLSNTTGGIMMGINKHGSNYKPTLFISTTQGSNETGKVGIGNVTSPSAKLHIKADSGERADLMLEATGTSAIYFKNTDNSISLTGNIMTLSASGFSYTNGNVAIGTMPNNDYKLAVKGIIRSEEVVVELMTSWPDYVFDSDYSLPKLKEVKAFVSENGHLPGLPNASQVSENGLGLGEMNAKLLEKIEELTLYIIEQEERIQKLEEKLNANY